MSSRLRWSSAACLALVAACEADRNGAPDGSVDSAVVDDRPDLGVPDLGVDSLVDRPDTRTSLDGQTDALRDGSVDTNLGTDTSDDVRRDSDRGPDVTQDSGVEVLRPSILDRAICETVTTTDLIVTTGVMMLDDVTGCDVIANQDSLPPDSGMGEPATPPRICVRVFRDIAVAAGASLELRASGLTGGNAIALVATNTISIEGRVDASGDLGRSGAGARARSDGQVGGNESSGGGGGGFGTAGANGGPGGFFSGGGGGGPEIGNPELVPLIGGQNGASNLAESNPRAPAFFALPGGGGGALQLVACNGMTLGAGGAIVAAGGGGGGGPGIVRMTPPSTDAPCGPGGAGGGSGGGILIEALTFVASGRIVANGGGGGSGGELGPDTSTAGAPGLRGSNGSLTRSPAIGGAPVSPDASAGGNGGSAEATPTPGRGRLTPIGAGAGGGASARIRINVARGGATLDAAVISPTASIGSARID